MMFYAICFLFLVSHILVCEGRQGCQNGWVTSDDSCYLFADEIKLDWTEATHFCASHGGSHVATIENEAELLFLEDQCKRLFKQGTSRDHWFWLGATDDEVEGVWVWYTDHSRLSDGYTNWYPGQPETGDKNNQDCACLWGPISYTWHDCHCELKSHFICEQSTSEQEIIG
ncbi:perlucin-like [Mercenaria mercenaria]|uniref:perlucin-like n=1 Tax=Mercenaria mercenaria TaxID=6596 RepID=UPI00234F23BC|nr:perlucin-like [Mercenaria mercenaria]